MLTEYHLDYKKKTKKEFLHLPTIDAYVRKTQRFKDKEVANQALEELLKKEGLTDFVVDKVDIFIDHFEVSDHTITVAIIDRETTFEAGVSICIPEDQFSKKVGRDKAIGRAVSSNHMIQIPKKDDIKDFFEVRDIIKAEMEDVFGYTDHAKESPFHIRPRLDLFARSVEQTIRDFEIEGG